MFVTLTEIECSLSLQRLEGNVEVLAQVLRWVRYEILIDVPVPLRTSGECVISSMPGGRIALNTYPRASKTLSATGEHTYHRWDEWLTTFG